MSYDLEVAIHDEPGDAMAAEFARDRSVAMRGSLDRDRFVHMTRLTKRGTSVGFTVDGPLRVEPEDLSQELVDAVIAPRWILQISVPAAGSGPDLALARTFARHVAK